MPIPSLLPRESSSSIANAHRLPTLVSDRSVEFTVYGLAQPKGSTKSFKHPITGAVVTTHDNPKTRSWQGSVATAAADAAEQAGWTLVSDGAVSVSVVYVFLRPPSVRPRTRPFHTVKPDGDKLERGILDALTGVLWRDDAQVVEWHGWKRYADAGESACAQVSVRLLREVPDGR